MEKYSRLKTRKVLGVGQTMSGVISSSKIIQLLGPMDYEYKMPIAFSCWHILKAVSAITLGITLILSGFTNMMLNFWFTNNEISNFKVLLSHSGGCICGYGVNTLLCWINGNRQNMVLSCISSLIIHFIGSIAITMHYKNTSIVWPLVGMHVMTAVLDGIFIMKALDGWTKERIKTDDKSS